MFVLLSLSQTFSLFLSLAQQSEITISLKSLILYEEAIILFSHCVVLLNGVDVESLQLHHRLDVSLECVQLSEPVTTMEKNFRMMD